MNLIKLFTSSVSKLNTKQRSYITRRFTSTENESIGKKIYPSEDIPPIPKYKGWPGDNNYQAQRKIAALTSKFRYGSPVNMKQTRIRGHAEIRIEPINKCPNRRFYRIALCHSRMGIRDGQLEDLGSFDPLPNKDNEILVTLNINRIKEHLRHKVPVSGIAAELLGLAGFLPIHPMSYLKAYRNRRAIEEAKAKTKAAEMTDESN